MREGLPRAAIIGRSESRPELAACLDYMREGDTLVITRLDRLARSITHLLEIVALAERKKVALRILSLGIDTGTASGRLILTVLGAIAEFERTLDARTPEGRNRQGARPTAATRAERRPCAGRSRRSAPSPPRA